jgi:hypothetical protein
MRDETKCRALRHLPAADLSRSESIGNGDFPELFSPADQSAALCFAVIGSLQPLREIK